MATKPRTKELCWKLIEMLEKEKARLEEANREMSEIYARALTDKDMAFARKCDRCRMQRARG